MTVYRLEEMFPQDVEERLKANPILVLSFGTIEWHSHHLPLGLDGIVAGAIAERIADGADAVLCPVSYWAVGGVPYPYTLNLPASVVEPLLVALFEQFGAMGFKVIVAFTGHFGLEQTLTLKRAALTVMRRSPVLILPLTEYDLTTDADYKGDHAGIGETSLLWAQRPDLVRLDAVPEDVPLDGVLGADPRGAARDELGQALMVLIAERAASFAGRLLNETSALERSDYLSALAAGGKVLEKTADARQSQPKASVPSITTPAYLAFCQAMYQGHYREAQKHAERKWAALGE
ncbi:MAG: creatininase family protein [Chloroflexi bacterium]|nr:creatininase family protein [Chloroflexota bacterium]